MKKVITYWAIKDKKGNIMRHTIRPTKYECAVEAPEKFGGFWSLTPFVKKVEKNGYKFCKLKLVEIL